MHGLHQFLAKPPRGAIVVAVTLTGEGRTSSRWLPAGTVTPILNATTESHSVSSGTPTDPPTGPTAAEARAAAQAAKIEQYIARVVATAPPLTDQQWSEIADLLREVPDDV
jgi:hypothetical protein